MKRREGIIFRTEQLNPEIWLVESGYINKGPDKGIHPVLWTRTEFCERERAIELTQQLSLLALVNE